jgi:hypothetical protein
VSVVYLILDKYAGLSIWPATLISVAVGFGFRATALWFAWEEPMPKVPKHVMGEIPKRESLKEKMKPGWEPKYD